MPEITEKQEDVRSFLTKATEFHDFAIRNPPSGSCEINRRNVLFRVLCELSLEHHGSIIWLLHRPYQIGSALALLRPLVETTIRAYWVRACATEEELQSITQKECDFPTISKCFKAVESHFVAAGSAGLFALPAGYLKQLHGFTHSGLEQIEGRIGPDFQIKPQYKPGTVKLLLKQSTEWLARSLILETEFLEDKSAPESQRFSLKYVELFKPSEDGPPSVT